jgi:hypothetical protein
MCHYTRLKNNNKSTYLAEFNNISASRVLRENNMDSSNSEIYTTLSIFLFKVEGLEPDQTTDGETADI